MSGQLQVCLYNTEPQSAAELESAIRSLKFVRLIRTVSNPEELSLTLQDAPINLLFCHLDPDPTPIVKTIDHIAQHYPDVAIVAISHKIGPEAILAPMRAGCDQFVCEPIDPEDLASAVSRVASKRLLSQAKCRRICITGASGGAGATSMACNLAMEMARATERECALADLNLQFGDVAVNFDGTPRYTLYDLAVAGSELDRSVLASTLIKLPCDVSILARPDMVEQREAVTPDTIHRVIEMLATEFESIVLDVPRDLGPVGVSAFGHADYIFIVLQLLVPSIRNAQRYYEALLRLGISGDRIEFIVNRSDGRNGNIKLKDIEETIKKPVYACIPNDYQFVARSLDFGKPVAALDRNNPVRSAIRKIAERIVSANSSKKGQASKRRGLLSRLLTK